MADDPEYEDIEFSTPPKPSRVQHHIPAAVPQPVAPPRTSSRYVERQAKLSG